ncbi:MAG: hypothetical protein JWR10_1333, partial [Rubritepida sp.]|nr:hypothetical protein [Rubritepida sp.]
MMRASHLAALAGAAALLSACGVTTNGGVRPVGGDVFVLETSGMSGSRAVETGLDEAQRFCAQNGRQFSVQNSRVGSSLYQLEFRCLSPMGVAGRRDPLLAAAATPVAGSVAEVAPRRRLRRRAAVSAEAG